MPILKIWDEQQQAYVDIPAIKGANGPQGPAGPAGPNEVSTTTATNITGLIKGNGSTVQQAVAGEDYAEANHTQSASTVTAGTFAGQVVANSAGQSPSVSLLRNSKLVATETTPTVDGEICWTYE